jgi:hypothetical protein
MTHQRLALRTSFLATISASVMSAASTVAFAADYQMTTPIPSEIVTPASVDTRIGKLEFNDGVPTVDTAQRVWDQLDFSRGIEAFLNGIPGASMVAIRTGLRQAGAVNETIGVFETLMDSKSLFLTANSETVYFWNWMDLKDGPVVVESPPGILGVVDDFWFRYVTDLGNAGPDKGKGGKYLFVPPGWKGEKPKGFFVIESPTYGNLLFGRAFMKNGDPAPGVASLKKSLRVYPWDKRHAPPATTFLNMSGMAMNTVHANNMKFFEEVNQIIQEEPAGAYGPDMTGIFAAIGMEKGKPFTPDERMTKILTDAVAVGNAAARNIDFRPRDPAVMIYPDRKWTTPFIGGSYEWLTKSGARNFDARTLFYYAATINTPAMAIAMPGIGSQYAATNFDKDGTPFDGGKVYRLRVPADVPAKDFWSVVVYDTQTRSMLQTDQQFPSLSSEKDLKKNADGSTDIIFSPTKPTDTPNWVQTIPGKSWFTIFRLYGPLKPWFDKSWKLEDFVEVK